MASPQLPNVDFPTMRANLQSAVDKLYNGEAKAVATSSGNDTITIDYDPAVTAYITGQEFIFKAGGTNTGSGVTININGLGAKTAKKPFGSALDSGYISADKFYKIIYDGTNILVSPVVDLPAITASTYLKAKSDASGYEAKTASQVAADVAANWVDNAPAGTQIGYAYATTASNVTTTSNTYQDVLTISYAAKKIGSVLELVATAERVFANFDYGAAEADAEIRTSATITIAGTETAYASTEARCRSKSDGEVRQSSGLSMCYPVLSTTTDAVEYKLKVKAITSGHTAALQAPIAFIIREIAQ